ncbi:zinc metalloproteinase-disintegrin-like batroxstatin-1, partial [Sycon ciliatum]|uniref:zinc metalloproteinase-disintegrin-like batroxstatin-1 n=1 Tax=Sycon ciliatum TaxID=27933 RepID=UPI0031F61B18
MPEFSSRLRSGHAGHLPPSALLLCILACCAAIAASEDELPEQGVIPISLQVQEKIMPEPVAMEEHMASADLHPIHMGSDPRLLVDEHHTFIPVMMTSHIMTPEQKLMLYTGTLTVGVSGFGKTWILDLLQNRLAIGRRGMNFRLDPETGELLHDEVGAETCYYHGVVRGMGNKTWVAASTCSGFSATFFDGIAAYNTAPLEKGATMSSRHIIYRTAEAHSKFTFRCGLDHAKVDMDRAMDELAVDVIGEEELRRAKRQTFIPGPANTRREIDLFMVAELNLLTANSGNTAAVETLINNIINLMDMAYMTLNFRIRLSGLLQLTDTTDVATTTNANVLLRNFRDYIRSDFLNFGVTVDAAMLISGVDYDGGTLGIAFLDTVCTRSGVGVNQHAPGAMVSMTAMTVTHELGHVLSMEHDDEIVPQDCNNCPANAPCLMNSFLVSTGRNLFSQCSADFINSIRDDRYCLAEVAVAPDCGDGFVGEGEECDCGPVATCDNPCCNAATCTLTAGSECAQGNCCVLATCQFQSQGLSCRARDDSNPCDLEDFCSGTSEMCPESARRNGETCEGSDTNLCWEGNCISRTTQCQDTFGPEEMAGSDLCYTVLNIRSDLFGHCNFGVDGAGTTIVYQACASENALCGKLHCANMGNAFPSNFGFAVSSSNASVGGGGCRSAVPSDIDYVRAGAPHPFLVSDGMNCGSAADPRVCVNQECLAQSNAATGVQMCPTGAGEMECSGQGICDNAQQCRCVAGITGAACEEEIDNCDPQPCGNGATCTDLGLSFECTCASG